MEISSIFTFLVHPGKKEDTQPEIGGASLPLEGKLFHLLSNVFNRATEDCNIDIAFTAPSDGTQVNARRQEIMSLIQSEDINQARAIAQHLQSVTTHRSGLGLLFIVLGKEDSKERAYISRFPADIGIVAEETSTVLSVELLERVFMKNTVSYKAVVFDGDNYDSGFWKGKAIDKQVNNKAVAISGYWIRDFLLSDFFTTSAQGTRRLAVAIKSTIEQTADMEIKEELTAAATLARSLDGVYIDMDNFAERFGLSGKTQNALVMTLKDPNLRFDQFRFSSREFYMHVRYRSLQIDNGAMLTAPVGKFDEVFSQQHVADDGSQIIFSTRGTIINEHLRTKR